VIKVSEIKNKIEKAKGIKKYYDQLKIGYGGADDCNCVVGPEPFYISKNEHEILTQQGRIIRKWFEITNKLCRKAYTDKEFKWLAEIIEGRVSPEAVEVHRRAYRENLVSLPALARADMSDLSSTVEIQVPGSGWGYMTAVHSVTNGSSCLMGPTNGFGRAITSLSGNGKMPSAYILYNDNHFHEVKYFCESCRNDDVALEMFFKSVPESSQVKFVRRPPLEDLVQYQGADKLIEAYFKREIVIEPSLSLIFDQKIAAAFPFDPRLRDYYSDEIRSIFPETYLIQNDVIPSFDGKLYKWDEIISLSRKKRSFIVKYAGAKKGLRAGGKAVYNLSDCSLAKAGEIVRYCLKDWHENRSPWLIQKRVAKKFDVTFLDPELKEIVTKPYYAMFRPMYLFDPKGSNPEIISHCALFRKEWKVHGSSDAVTLPVEIKN
jgi:hypothetical protein